MKRNFALWAVGLAATGFLSCTACGKAPAGDLSAADSGAGAASTSAAASSSSDHTATALPQQDEQFQYTAKDGMTLVTAAVERPVLPEGIPDAAAKKINDYYDAVYEEERTWWEGELSEFAAEDREQSTAQDMDFRPYTVQESSEVKCDDERYLSVLRLTQSYTGGAHDNQAVACETFRKSDGERAMLKDLFRQGTDYETKLVELTRQQMLERENTDAIGYYDNAEELLSEAISEQDFYLTRDALTLVYPCYTLAPYAAGTQYFEIPFTALADELRSE